MPVSHAATQRQRASRKNHSRSRGASPCAARSAASRNVLWNASCAFAASPVMRKQNRYSCGRFSLVWSTLKVRNAECYVSRRSRQEQDGGRLGGASVSRRTSAWADRDCSTAVLFLLSLVTEPTEPNEAEAAPLAAHLDMTLRQWVERYQKEIVFDQVHYRGVPALKNVLDLWVLQEIIWETGVEVVVEVGVRYGGTTLWLADLLRTFRGSAGLVIGVDIERLAGPLPPNVHFIQADSIAADTVATVAQLCAGRRTMVMVDGNHAAAHVLQELHLYTPLVSEGCYFIAEDGIVDVMNWTHATPGPLVAVQQFLAGTDEFVADRAREKFILTYTPGGFLKRVGPAA